MSCIKRLKSVSRRTVVRYSVYAILIPFYAFVCYDFINKFLQFESNSFDYQRNDRWLRSMPSVVICRKLPEEMSGLTIGQIIASKPDKKTIITSVTMESFEDQPYTDASELLDNSLETISGYRHCVALNSMTGKSQ